MYLHIGGDTLVPVSAIVAVCDLDNASWALRTREFLRKMQEQGRVVSATDDLPKSFVLCEENGVQTLYLSQLNSATLLRRAESGRFIDSDQARYYGKEKA